MAAGPIHVAVPATHLDNSKNRGECKVEIRVSWTVEPMRMEVNSKNDNADETYPLCQ